MRMNKMSKINIVYFSLTGKCCFVEKSGDVSTNRLVCTSKGIPSCVYFETENGKPFCRQGNCLCVEKK